MTFLEETFKKLSQKLHNFQHNTYAIFNTVELPKEKATHQCKSAQCFKTTTILLESSRPRVKMFNLSTYKFHAMTDYARTIRLFGTTDSFTTQMVSTWYIIATHMKLTLARGSFPIEL